MKHGPACDPFGELQPANGRRRFDILGCSFEFRSDAPQLLALAEVAYAGLPPQLLPRAGATIRILLRMGADAAGSRWRTPPALRTHAGGGLISGVIDAGNFATLSPDGRTALIVCSPRLLRAGYHARYELLEFCVYMLASRCRQLVSLHGAALGRGGRAVLVIGASGSGKSTLVLHGLQRGLQLLSEDAVLVDPESLLATGVPSFLHLRTAALGWLQDPGLQRAARRAPRIRRRSGVRKVEIDVRRTRLRMASQPLRIDAVVMLSARRASAAGAWRRLGRDELQEMLQGAQAYAAAQPGWRRFLRALRAIPAYELRRQSTPDAAAAQLVELLAGTSQRISHTRSVSLK